MNTLYEGLSLMFIGMGTVFAFLTMLVVIISLVSKVITRYFPEAEALSESAEPQQDKTLVAVITAAIAQHRKSKKS